MVDEEKLNEAMDEIELEDDEEEEVIDDGEVL